MNPKYTFFHKPGMPPYLRFSFKAGSVYDTKPGIAHFLEHMLVAGTTRFPSKDILAEYIQNNGGTVSLYTNSDEICINFQIAVAEDLHIVTTLLQEMVFQSLFDEETIEKERGAIVQEIKNKKANQQDYLFEVQKKLYFQNTPFSLPTLGTVESVKTISKQDLIDFKDQYLLNNISIIICGDIDEEQCKTTINAVLNDKQVTVPQPSYAVPQTEKYYELEVYPSDIIDVAIGFPTQGQSLTEKLALDCISMHLGGGRSSELIKELRYKQGLIYSIGSFNRLFIGRGLVSFTTRSTLENLAKVLEGITMVIKNTNETLTESAFADLKQRIKKSSLVRLQSAESWVNFYDQLNKIDTKISYADFMHGLEQLSLNDVRAVFAHHFAKPMLVAFCGPTEAGDVVANVF